MELSASRAPATLPFSVCPLPRFGRCSVCTARRGWVSGIRSGVTFWTCSGARRHPHAISVFTHTNGSIHADGLHATPFRRHLHTEGTLCISVNRHARGNRHRLHLRACPVSVSLNIAQADLRATAYETWRGLASHTSIPNGLTLAGCSVGFQWGVGFRYFTAYLYGSRPVTHAAANDASSDVTCEKPSFVMQMITLAGVFRALRHRMAGITPGITLEDQPTICKTPITA